MAEPNTDVFLLAGVLLFALGFLGLTAAVPAIRRVLSANVMANGVFLVLVALAARAGPEGPDPVPQAMVLTGIVVSVCATGLALVLSQRERDARSGGSGDARSGGAVTRTPSPPSEARARPGGSREG